MDSLKRCWVGNESMRWLEMHRSVGGCLVFHARRMIQMTSFMKRRLKLGIADWSSELGTMTAFETVQDMQRRPDC